MTSVALAIAIHVLAVIWWIGGLAFVTTVVLPALRAGQMSETHASFQIVEKRFAPQARLAVLLAGLSGLFMLIRLNLWAWFLEARFWWLDAMVLFWILFALMLFIVEPLGLLERVVRGAGDPKLSWTRMHRIHWVLLIAALVIVAAAVSGSHGA
jgi:uncharacterized membrane protein